MMRRSGKYLYDDFGTLSWAPLDGDWFTQHWLYCEWIVSRRTWN